MAVAYRIQQGLLSLFAFSLPLDTSLAEKHLSPELFALFGRMKRSEQMHSLNVLRDVLAQGPTPPELATAALLHDVGKSRYPLGTWHKTAAVLVRKFAPAFARRLSDGDPAEWWKRPFVVYVHHPAWSADLLAQAGAPEAAVWLAAHHQDSLARWVDHPYAPLLQRLKQADDAN